MRSIGWWSCLGVLLWGAFAFMPGCGAQQKKAENKPEVAEKEGSSSTIAYRKMEPGEEEKGDALDETAPPSNAKTERKTRSRVVPAVVPDTKPAHPKSHRRKSVKKEVKQAAAKSRVHEDAAPKAPETTAAPSGQDIGSTEPALLAPSASEAKPMAAKPSVDEEPAADEEPEADEEPAAEAPAPAMPKMAAPSESATPSTGTFTPTSDGQYTVVRVFYGTDRAAVDPAFVKNPLYYQWLLYTLSSAGGTLVLASLAFYFWPRRLLKILAGLGITATLLLGVLTGYVATQGKMPGAVATEKSAEAAAYGPDRGRLELGTCEVSIPKEHEVGELESPSVLRLEFREDPEKHVVLLGVTRQPAEEFFKQIQTCVGQSAQKAAFVFVHGYNVSFEDAARRTAQMAYDLKFDGAPVFYSWPSQASMLGYTVDETNVEWSVPHLKQFLTDLAAQSGAKQIHLVAHSMGNRALTSALKELASLPESDRPKFNEVLLTAPDVDADTFKERIAPALAQTARRITLYASSNDEALAASKKVHGYPRAGESGENMVIVPGIETVDVSAVDTSLLGHCYYGDNRSVLADIFEVLHDAKPPSQRTWLEEAKRGLDRYWIFHR
ncbi:MAG: alpha/beta fold hydrolase [Pirellulales bacterium]|nr:alpha/beta fold hydrolase [Pirellulales bacterium]